MLAPTVEADGHGRLPALASLWICGPALALLLNPRPVLALLRNHLLRRLQCCLMHTWMGLISWLPRETEGLLVTLRVTTISALNFG